MSAVAWWCLLKLVDACWSLSMLISVYEEKLGLQCSGRTAGPSNGVGGYLWTFEGVKVIWLGQRTVRMLPLSELLKWDENGWDENRWDQGI